jgi:protein SCO1/2
VEGRAVISRRGCLALLGLLPVAAAALPVAESLERRRRPGSQRPAHGFHEDYFPDLVLRTQDGEPVRLHTDLLKGKTVLVHFFYAGGKDGMFPDETGNLVEVQRLLAERCGRDVFMYSFTLDPRVDTPERLKTYRASYPIAPGWTFVTGSKRDMALCRARFGIADPDPALDRVPARLTNLVLLGNEPHERWLAAPALSNPAFLLEQLDRVAGVKT